MAWTVALMIAAPAYMTTGHVFLTSLGLLLNATVAVTGMVVVGGRWAYRLGWGVIAICGLVAVVRPVDVWWWVGLGSILTGAVLLLAAASGIRRLPAATGPGDGDPDPSPGSCGCRPQRSRP